MPYKFQLKPDASRHVLAAIQNAVYTPVGELKVDAWVTDEPVAFAERETGAHAELKPGDSWGKLFDCAWMNFTGTIPANAAGQAVVLLIDFNGEGYVADQAGNPILGLTTRSSQYDFQFGIPVKKVVPITQKAAGGELIDIWVDAGNNDLFGNQQHRGALEQAQFAILKPQMRALAYDYEVLTELMEQLDPKSARAQRLRAKLYEASLLLRGYTQEEAAAARAVLAPELTKRGGDPSLTISAIGHAHMDLAWLWPVRETVRKCARTFSTVLHNMEIYPDYLFGASQPQQYQWVKDSYPTLYARIKEKVSEGRWEPQGAMWVEPDTNITGGETLVRQILYGKQYFREEFGVEPDYLWEPDVFGYTGALPQILAKSGVRYFMTQKMSWNEINKFPHQTFWWEGIDGSRVLAHMLPEENYLSPGGPRALRRIEYNYFDSPVSDRCLMLFGIGDGGGGPGEEHLERIARVKNLEGLCPLVQEPSATFFNRLDANADRYVTWRGELYLEKHQGTLTSQARSKRYNRKLEYLLREVELSAVWALQQSAGGYAYPKSDLDRIWKEVLLYQFHDILPGSSITRVYDESLARYAVLEDELKQLLREADAAWCEAEPVLVNSLSWARDEWLKHNGAWRKVALPALGRTALSEATVTATADLSSLVAGQDVIENDLLRIAFSADGGVLSVFDKQAGKEVLEEGEPANRLSIYDDPGDAWDLPIDFDQIPPVYPSLESRQSFLDGPNAILRSEYRTDGGKSTIWQDVVLRVGSRRVDFVTKVDWNESGKMLRASFPVNVRAGNSTSDIQFGTIQRPTTSNTTWDSAVHEIAAHKWVDLSEPGYGVALLNDCKYGHRVKGNVLDINLLRSTRFPDPVADHAVHEFTYALYPHRGNHVDANVMRAGYELNIPIRVVEGASTAAFAAEWLTVDAESIVVETVKQSEAVDAVIVRLYESSGTKTQAVLKFGFDVQSVELVDMMEKHPEALGILDGQIALVFKPFEIHTVKLIL